MRRPSGETENGAALDRLVEVGRNSAKHPTRAELDHGLSAVRARLDRGRTQRQLTARLAIAVVLVALPLAWFFGAQWLAPDPPALTYEIEGGSILDGGYLRESGDSGITLAFNEGSRFVLTPGTRGRLRTIDRERTRIGIENGAASFEVTPNSGRRWEVEVGPFLVTVTGTAFTVWWDVSTEQFELQLRKGQVVVSGPVSGGELTLKAGQRLVVSLPKAQTLITEDRFDATTEEAQEASVTPAPTASADSEGKGGASSTSEHGGKGGTSSQKTTRPRDNKEPGRRWREELAHGRWDSILADVERAGVSATLSSASSEDLFALANAARYRRRTDLARQALLAQRSRFPQSSRALDAAFLLGRVEEARGNGSARAIAWYDEYLAKAPSGAYAAEALGRKMTIVNKASGPNKARPIAKDYLRRFPKGSYAGSARALLDER